jgi:hypothetical protein
MIFGISCDFSWETKVSEFLDLTNSRENNIREFFQDKKYGEKPNEIFIVLVCHEPELNYKQRKRFSKKENIFYLDIMLDYKQMVNSEKLKRNEIISEKIIIDLVSALKKYKFPKFELQEFETDLTKYFAKK